MHCISNLKVFKDLGQLQKPGCELLHNWQWVTGLPSHYGLSVHSTLELKEFRFFFSSNTTFDSNGEGKFDFCLIEYIMT